jgi:hypothetical protein
MSEAVLNELGEDLSARERVALFCAATGIDHPRLGIMASTMPSMRLRGLVVRQPEGAYALTDSGRIVFRSLLDKAGFKLAD